MISISVPRLPMGMRRRYAPPPQDRSRQRRSFWQSLNLARPPARPLQMANPVASILAPDRMPGVEYSGLSNVGGFPDMQDSADPDAFVYLRSPGDVASGAPYMAGALFHEPTPPTSSPSPASDEPTPEASRETTTPDEMELPEQSCVSYEESVFSEDIEDEYAVEEGENPNTPTAELFKDDDGHMELEQDFGSLPGQFEQHGPSQASSSLTYFQAVPTRASAVFETATLSIEKG